MVYKTRTRSVTVPYVINGTFKQQKSKLSVTETMTDSSITGSPRTDLDAVDGFLEDPTNQSDFHAALRASHESAGDAGIADFRVDRTRTSVKTSDFVINRRVATTGAPAGEVIHTGWAPRPSTYSGFPTLAPFPVPNNSELKAVGEKLYSKAVPNKDQSDLGVAIAEIISNPALALKAPGFSSAEAVSVIRRQTAARNDRVVKDIMSGKDLRKIRELHPRLQQPSLSEAQAAADDYLAYIFGVRPTISTFQSATDSINHQLSGERILSKSEFADLTASTKRARNYATAVSASGKKRIRRRRSTRTKSDIASSTSTGAIYALSNGNDVRLNGTIQKFSERTSATWWSGAFRMSVSDTDSWLSQSSEVFRTIDRVTGLGLDASAIWDLLPYSFMVDWFANTGDFLSNRQVIADYNIACEYGYVMNHNTHVNTLTCTGSFDYSKGGYVGSTEGSAYYRSLKETKLRTRSGSYGFHTNYDGLNSFQWGALAAIGLSKGAGIVPNIRT